MDNKELNNSNSIFADCENAFRLIKEGKEKQAEKMFPMESYLINKYLFSDVSSLFRMLEERLTIGGIA